MSQAKPQRIELFPNREVGIVWDDGREDFIPAHRLRSLCPCAQCVDEITGVRTLRPVDVPQRIEVERWEGIGNYAVRFFFSDGHSVGMYTFPALREIGARLGLGGC